MAHSHALNAETAWATAKSEVEQALWTVMLGPFRLSLYDTLVAR